MTDRKTLKVRPETKAQLVEAKRDIETWDACLRRLVDEATDD